MRLAPATDTGRDLGRAGRASDARMPLREHLTELRNRLFLALAGVVVGAVIGNLAANVPQTFAWRIQTAGFAAVRVRLVSIAAGALVVTLI